MVARSARLRAMVTKSRVVGSCGTGRHDCERRVGAGLGQVMRGHWTTRSVMLGY